MKIQLVPLVALGVLAWTALACSAQELPRPKELPRELPIPETKPAPLPPVEGYRPCNTVPKVLVYEREVPVQILVERPGPPHIEEVPTLAIVMRPEKRTVTHMVLKPRPVSREVCYTTLEPCPVTDPCTGETTTVMKPVERTRIQKDVEFVAVPVEEIVTVPVPYLKEVKEAVERKTFLLEYRTVMQKQTFALGIPSEAPLPERTVVTPQMPACSADAHP